MHICYLTHEYPPAPHGGVGSFTQSLGRALAARDHHVSSVGLYPPELAGHENDHGVQVVRVARSTLPKISYFLNGSRLRKTLLALHCKNPIDIIEGPELSLSSIPKSFPAVKVIRMHGGHHYLSTSLGGKPRLGRKYLEKISFSHSDNICAVSKFVGETTRKLLQLGKQHIEVIYNPVDTESFCPKPGIPVEKRLILFVGTVYPVKGIKQLIQAMPEVVNKFPESRLLVVGSEWLNPKTGESYTAELRRSISSDLKKHITFTGVIPHTEIPNIMASAEVCVYPSLIESMPMAWIEGLASGKAIVASRTGPGPEIVKDEETGLLCNPYEPQSIAEKLIKVLENDELRKKLENNARVYTLKHFSLEKIVVQNESYYKRLIEGRDAI